MRVVLTVKMVPEPGEILDPYDIANVMEGYRMLHEKSVLGIPKFVSLRFMVQCQSDAEITVPKMQEEAQLPIENIPVIE
jgi:hypothetical protein